MRPNLESLACPLCNTRFGFGSTCPDCNVALVSESFTEVCKDDRPPKEITGWKADALRVVAFVAEVNGLG